MAWYISSPRKPVVTSHRSMRFDVQPTGAALDWRRASKRGRVRGL